VIRIWLIALAVSISAERSVFGQTPVSSISQQLRTATLDVARASRVERVNLTIGPAQVELTDGVLIPAQPIEGAVVEAVFIGQGRLKYEPPDAIERAQLELFSKRTSLDLEFEDAVLAGPGVGLATLVRSDAAPLSAELASKAQASWVSWKDGVVREPHGVVQSIHHALLGEPHRTKTSFLHVILPKLGNLLISFDPDASEPYRIEAYERITLSEWEKMDLVDKIRRHRREGQLRTLDLNRLARWDLWTSSKRGPIDSIKTATGLRMHATAYQLQITVDRDVKQIRATSRVGLKVSSGSTRVAAARCESELLVDRVRLAGGPELNFEQQGGRLWVRLDRSYQAGESLELELEFRGPAFEAREKGMRIPLSTVDWHPRFEATIYQDSTPATDYDVTIRVPKGSKPFTGGEIAESGTDGDVYWERHRSLGPSPGLFLYLGELESYSFKIGATDVTVWNDRRLFDWREGERTDLQADVADVLRWLTEKMGPLPTAKLQVLLGDQWFGQSIAGGVVIPYFLRRGRVDGGGPVEDYRLFWAHELAHQWWGVGLRPRSYRDRWLSEGMSDFLSQMYAREVIRGKHELRFKALTRNWIARLGARSAGPRPVESIGPVILGARLDSSQCRGCDEPIVYLKGALALEALSGVLGARRTQLMLRELTTRLAGKDLTTDQFLASMQKMSGEDLSWFRRRYVDGTGYPIVNYKYRIERSPTSGWDVHVTLRQQATRWHKASVIAVPPACWDVKWIPVEYASVGDAPLAIPWTIRCYHPDEPQHGDVTLEKATRKQKSNYQLNGMVVALETEWKFTVHVDYEPQFFVLDRDQTSLIYPYCETCNPKWALHFEARERMQQGDLEAAQRLLHEALSAPLDNSDEEPEDGTGLIRRRQQRSADALVCFSLANLELERHSDAKAREYYDRGRALITSEENQAGAAGAAEILRARLLLRAGEAERAFKALWQIIEANEDLASEDELLLGVVAATRAGKPEAAEKYMEKLKEKTIDIADVERFVEAAKQTR
jgi:hypothetical protein